MFKINYLAVVATVAAVLFFSACEQEQTAESIYPENEIPVSTNSDEALQAFVDGLAQQDLGNGRKARPLFDKALELDPDFVSAQMYRTFTSNSAKDFGENVQKFLGMRDKANEGEALMMDLMQARMSNDELKELEICQALVEKYPSSARAQDNLAGTYNALEDVSKAREHWSKALELNSDFMPAISSLGGSYMFDSPKDFQKAEEYMGLAVEKAPENSRAHINLGDCYRAQKDLEKALASYLKAAELDPGDDVAFAKAGHANSFLGNYDAARKNYQDARAASEFGTGSYNWEALTYLYEGDHEKALAFFEVAVKEINGLDNPASNKNGSKMNCTFNSAMIAMHYGDAERLKEAVAMMKPLSDNIISDVGTEGVKLNQTANMQYWDGVTSAIEGNYEDAAAKAELIKSTLESVNDPQKLRPYHRLYALINYKQGDYDKALEHISELNMDNVYDKYWAAKAYQASGNTEKAMEMFNDVVDNNFNGVGYALIRGEVQEILAEG